MNTGGSAMSRQEILDDPSASFPQLRQFLGSYFHQDWPVERARWEEVVDDFMAESPRSVVADSAAELASLVGEPLTDVELEAVLDGLGCSVDPSAFNLGPGDWLRAVARRLNA
jgi:hypothetical protein